MPRNGAGEEHHQWWGWQCQRTEGTRKRGHSRCTVSNPALMNMSWIGHNGRERQICSCSLCAHTSCSKYIKGREKREKGEWLADSCRAPTSISIGLTSACHLPVLHKLGQLTWREQSWRKQPSGVLVQLMWRVSKHIRSMVRPSREVKQRSAGPWFYVFQASDSLTVVWWESCCKT